MPRVKPVETFAHPHSPLAIDRLEKARGQPWATATVNLTAFAGQTVRILVEAADASGASLVEAAIDDVRRPWTT